MQVDQGTYLFVHVKKFPGAILLDPEDFERFRLNKVYINPNGYVRIWIKGKCYQLHQAIMDFKYELIDHKNQIKTDCRKENLRPATRSQNGHNQGVRINNTSGFKGVDYQKRTGTWQARIRHNGKRIHIGSHYKTPELAYEAYKKKAKELFGEFAED